MKTTIRLLLAFAVVIIFSISCNKENNDIQPKQKSSFISDHNNKIFAGENHGNLFAANKFKSFLANINAQYLFANNTGNYNFSGGTPGEGGDQPPGQGIGSFTANGVTHPLIFGAYYNYYDGWFDLFMINKILSGPDDEFIDVSGIMFELISNSANEITSGTYYYSESENPFTFPYANVAINANTQNEEYFDLIDGSLSIINSGNSYTINFEGTLDNGGTVTGYFTGQLADYSDNPEPTPSYNMTASINGSSWSAQYASAYIYEYDGYITINGSNNLNEGIDITLDISSVSAGAQLTIDNGGVIGAYYTDGVNYYYTDFYAYVNISAYNSSTVSGTFGFEAEDYYSGDIVTITNGAFSNVPIY
ncbi:MAG: hypothetical protein ISS18_01000 [Bacteroidales bacterium]|nr:hypothetical protein [Bacteroidales bacterium]